MIIEEHNLIPFYITLLVVHKWFGIDVCEEREREREKERERERERERMTESEIQCAFVNYIIISCL